MVQQRLIQPIQRGTYTTSILPVMCSFTLDIKGNAIWRLGFYVEARYSSRKSCVLVGTLRAVRTSSDMVEVFVQDLWLEHQHGP